MNIKEISGTGYMEMGKFAIENGMILAFYEVNFALEYRKKVNYEIFP